MGSFFSIHRRGYFALWWNNHHVLVLLADTGRAACIKSLWALWNCRPELQVRSKVCTVRAARKLPDTDREEAQCKMSVRKSMFSNGSKTCFVFLFISPNIFLLKLPLQKNAHSSSLKHEMHVGFAKLYQQGKEA